MNYYIVINRNAYCESIKRFVVKTNKTADVFLLAFDEGNFDFLEKHSEIRHFIDKSTKMYELKNGKAVYSGAKLKMSPNKWFHKMANLYSAIHKENECISRYVEKADETGIKQKGISFGKYKPFWFANKENTTAFPFRFKKSKGSEKQPLIVFFSGAGALGTDNIKPYFECLPMRMKLKKFNCNILIPQSNTQTNNGNNYMGFNDGLNSYVKSVQKLAERLMQNYSIDESRIYVFGTSFGGLCTWRSAYLFPDFYAAALSVVGCFDTKTENSEYADFERMVHLPIWAAHSSDDNNIRIDYDDYAVSRLKSLGGNIKYTRWKQYGHGMALHFYRKENWSEWMFHQKK